jgi:hypothetical protein
MLLYWRAKGKPLLGAPFFPRSRPKKWAPRSLSSCMGRWVGAYIRTVPYYLCTHKCAVDLKRYLINTRSILFLHAKILRVSFIYHTLSSNDRNVSGGLIYYPICWSQLTKFDWFGSFCSSFDRGDEADHFPMLGSTC